MRHSLSVPSLIAVIAAASLAVPVAHAQPPQDNDSIWTLQDENASISTSPVTDRYYTNGLRLGWVSPSDDVLPVLNTLDQWILGDGQQRMGFEVSQQIYTPDNTSAIFPPPGDERYAGVLTGNLSLLSDTDLSRSTLSIDAGVMGPDALGEEIQNGFHDLIGQGHDAGWDTQIGNRPIIEANLSRVWRLPLGNIAGIDTDLLPELAGGAGDLRVYGLGGANVRLGQGLDQDFGPARVVPGLSGGDVFRPTRDLGWYVFAGADVQAVAYDATLEGLSKIPVVPQAQAGLALTFAGTRISFADIAQGETFHHQRGGWHQFGSLALSIRL